MKKSGYPGWLGYIGDEMLSSYMGIKTNYYKDPYYTISIMESKRFFFVVAHIKLDLVNLLN